MGTPVITNIQRYSIHDGKGIRTTVFFKGCPLRCAWCHNPETQRFAPEILFDRGKCTMCAACASACPENAILMDEVNRCAYTRRDMCRACGLCADACLNGAREISGKVWSIRELLKELKKDRMFYEESGGGITLSGGEVLAQDTEYITELTKTLCQKGYSVDIDTCGHVPWSQIESVLPYTDVFLYDIKGMDPDTHREYTGQDNSLILENLKRLASVGAKISIRMPLVAGLNDTDGDIRACAAFLRENAVHPVSIHLLPYHDAGSGKYARLGLSYKGVKMAPPSPERLDEIKKIFTGFGFSDIWTGG